MNVYEVYDDPCYTRAYVIFINSFFFFSKTQVLL